MEICSCVPASAAAQNLEAPIRTNNNHPNNQRGVWSRSILCAWIRISGRLEHSSPVGLQPDFLEVGFKRIIGVDQIIICAG